VTVHDQREEEEEESDCRAHRVDSEQLENRENLTKTKPIRQEQETTRQRTRCGSNVLTSRLRRGKVAGKRRVSPLGEENARETGRKVEKAPSQGDYFSGP
jgi:hypothetical protein